MFFQAARHGGALLVGQVHAEFHFFTVGSQRQPAMLCAPGLPEHDLRPVAVKFKPANTSPVPALDHDPIAMDGHALVVTGVALHIMECQSHRHKIQSCKRQDRPSAVDCESKGNRKNDDRKRTQNEKPATRGKGVVAPGDERQFRRPLYYAAVHAKTPFCACLCEGPAKHKPVAFARGKM